MNVLDSILEHKRVEILKRKQKRSLSDLSTFPEYGRKTNRIEIPEKGTGPGIIAEFKRKSPSRGDINLELEPVEVAKGYADAGATAMSILTDRDFFGGSLLHLQKVRRFLPGLTLLRKDFIIDPYQLHETSAYGADLVLLIASILDKSEVKDLALEASSLSLQVLFEVHELAELEKYHDSIGLVGVNNRDLKTFRVNIERSIELIPHIPEGTIPVAESGIHGKSEIDLLQKAGFKLFLIGEAFMKQRDPGLACKSFINNL